MKYRIYYPFSPDKDPIYLETKTPIQLGEILSFTLINTKVVKIKRDLYLPGTNQAFNEYVDIYTEEIE